MKIKSLFGLFVMTACTAFADPAMAQDPATGAKPAEVRRPPVIDPTNFGLLVPQDPATLPRSTAAPQVPVRVAKRPAATRLAARGCGRWEIVGGWELAEADRLVAARGSLFDADYDTSEWYDATVPGTVLTTLVDQGVYPDPYYGLNNLAIPESLCRRDWWYRALFALPEAAGGRRVRLQFDGINYRADVWINGRRAGRIDGAFSRGDFDVTEWVRPEGNVVAVHIWPPANPGIPHEQSPASGRGPNGGQLCMDGPTFISSEGWDWIPGIRDRNIGIWLPVRLCYTGDVVLGDARVITDLPLPDTSSAELEIRTEVRNDSDRVRTAEVRGEIEGRRFSQRVTLAAGECREVIFTAADFAQLRVEHPRLWWPNGYGSQELYDLTLTTEVDGRHSDERQVRFGIRELTYELTVDAPEEQGVRIARAPLRDVLRQRRPVVDHFLRRDAGDGVSVPGLREGVRLADLRRIEADGTAPYLVLRVNGVRIFCRGGNWGMDDGMKRVSRERLEPALRLHKEAGFNMVRNWTGESTEELFYALCDEYGMLVWNDFWLSTEGYNLNVNDEELFMANVRETVRRFRNHPSLALWCPRNEGYAPPALEQRIAETIACEDGTRHYIGNSRYLNLRPSGPWHYYADAADYYRRNAKGFNTEQGTPSVPTAESMRKMMPEADLWPVSDTWYYHDLHFGLNEYRAAVDSLYGAAAGLDDFCRKVQLVNYDSHRAMIEAWNSRLWNSASGLLLWMSHPAWPSVEWQVYSWDYETFGSFYGCRKACEPLHVQLNLDDRSVAAVNTTREKRGRSVVTLTCYDLAGRCLSQQRHTLAELPANALTPCFKALLPKAEGTRLVRLTLACGGRTVSVNDYLLTDGRDFTDLNGVPAASLRGRIVVREAAAGGERVTFELANVSKHPAFAVKLNVRDAASGAAVLPAYLSDGYFHLLPGERRRVTAEFCHDAPAALSAEGYNVGRQELFGL